MPKVRSALLNSILKRDIAVFISKKVQLKDKLLTVSYVKQNKDGSGATVGLTFLPYDKKGFSKALTKIEKYKKELQGKIGRSHKLKKTPVLHFEYDRTHGFEKS